MTKREGAIVSAFTGVLACEFSDFHAYVEEKLGRAVFTHEMASDKVAAEIKEASRADFIEMAESCK